MSRVSKLRDLDVAANDLKSSNLSLSKFLEAKAACRAWHYDKVNSTYSSAILRGSKNINLSEQENIAWSVNNGHVDKVEEEEEEKQRLACDRLSLCIESSSMLSQVSHSCTVFSSACQTPRCILSTQKQHSINDIDVKDAIICEKIKLSSAKAFSSQSDQSSDQFCLDEDGEEFWGKILYNQDGSVYVIDSSDDNDYDLEELTRSSMTETSVIYHSSSSKLNNSIQPMLSVSPALFLIKPRACRRSNLINHCAPCLEAITTPIKLKFIMYNYRECGKDGRRTSTKSNIDKCLVPQKPLLMCLECRIYFSVHNSLLRHAQIKHCLEINEAEQLAITPNISAVLQIVDASNTPLLWFLEQVLSCTSPISSLCSSRISSVPLLMLQATSSQSSYAVSCKTDNVKFACTNPNLTKHTSNHQESPDKFIENASKLSALSEFRKTSSAFGLININDSHREVDSRITPPLKEMSVDRMALSMTKIDKMSPIEVQLNNATSQNHFTFAYDYPTSISLCNANIIHHNSLDTTSSTTHIPHTTPPATNNTTREQEPSLEHAQNMEHFNFDIMTYSPNFLGSHATTIHSRNSCKTLKCPKCNWHYKYQETLDIHMKEKHSDSETRCLYCLSSQTHPRLSRGENYSCGYKPFRCKICNYSTTTKGNLSIHMQSDKHVNNSQELSYVGSDIMPTGTLPTDFDLFQSQAESSTSCQSNLYFSVGSEETKKLFRQKPPWRCDICNYETLVARNLRIHITSEKHTHNALLLQQSMKFQVGQSSLMLDPIDYSALSFHWPATTSTMSRSISRCIDVDTCGVHHSLLPTTSGLINLFNQQSAGLQSPMYRKNLNGINNGDIFEDLFQCNICEAVSSNSLESLHQHMTLDRTKHEDADSVSFNCGIFSCNLCQYKTNLKANFQLHCKTDKHLQKLQIVNHIREGNPLNEWKLNCHSVSAAFSGQVRCNACTFYTSSVQKLQLHSSQPHHLYLADIFHQLQIALTVLHQTVSGSSLPFDRPHDRYYYHCDVCCVNSLTMQAMLRHASSRRHLLNIQDADLAHSASKEFIFEVKFFKDNDDILFEENIEGIHSKCDVEVTPDALSTTEQCAKSAQLAVSFTPASMSVACGTLTSKMSFTANSTATPTIPVPCCKIMSDGGVNSETSEHGVVKPMKDVLLSTDGFPVSCADICCNVSCCSSFTPWTQLDMHASQCQLQLECNTTECRRSLSKCEMGLNPIIQEENEDHLIGMCCPLCQCDFFDTLDLRHHLVIKHNVKPDGMQKLMSMVGLPELSSPHHKLSDEDLPLTSRYEKLAPLIDAFTGVVAASTVRSSSSSSGDSGIDATADSGAILDSVDALLRISSLPTKLTPWSVSETTEFNQESLDAAHEQLLVDCDGDENRPSSHENTEQLKCQICLQPFNNIGQLCAHQIELGHLELKQTPRGPDYPCWKNGCNQHLKTAETLQVHFREIHTTKAAERTNSEHERYKCQHCPLMFMERSSFIRHVFYHLAKTITRCGFCCKQFNSAYATKQHLMLDHSELRSTDMSLLLNVIDTNLKLLNSSTLCTVGEAARGCDDLLSLHYRKSEPLCTNDSHQNSMDKSSIAVNTTNVITGCAESMISRSAVKDAQNIRCSEPQSNKDHSKDNVFDQNLLSRPNAQCRSSNDRSFRFDLHCAQTDEFDKHPCLLPRNQAKGQKLADSFASLLSPDSFGNNCDLNYPFLSSLRTKVATQANKTCNDVVKMPAVKSSVEVLQNLICLNSVSNERKVSPITVTANLSSGSSSSTLSSVTKTTTNHSYKCNVCDCSFTQHWNLEDHFWSVEHQTRMATLHELIMSGRFVLNQPPIEYPDMAFDMLQAQQMQFYIHLFHQQQLCSIGSHSVMFPPLTTTSGQQILTPSAKNNELNLRPVCNTATGFQKDRYAECHANYIIADKISDEQATQSQEDKFDFDASNCDVSVKLELNVEEMHGDINDFGSSSSPEAVPKAEMSTNTDNSLTQILKCSDLQQSDAILAASMPTTCVRPRGFFSRFKPQVQRNLLENIGFECVMQFNECFHHGNKLLNEERIKEDVQNSEEVIDESTENMFRDRKLVFQHAKVIGSADMPEMNKCQCVHCGCEFSSVFVLKAHEEELHKQAVPISLIESFGETFKKHLEKSTANLDPVDTLHETYQTSTATMTCQTDVLVSSYISTDHVGDDRIDGVLRFANIPPLSPPASLNRFTHDWSQMLPVLGMLPMNMMNTGLHAPMINQLSSSAIESGTRYSPINLVGQKFLSAQQLQQAVSAVSLNQKRIRTRISDEQLKILRAHFDINNSPPEEQIQLMSELAGLPTKVIKHWFRNTLFKERQRNKDSPYNFNNPPSTSIDLDEYEKSGKISSSTLEKMEVCEKNEDECEDFEESCASNQSIISCHTQSLESMLPQSSNAEELEGPSITSNPSPVTTYHNYSLPFTTIAQTPSNSVASILDAHTLALACDAFSDNQSMNQNKRANRTRFTDCQVRILQEYFDQNAYPKDDDLNSLSKVLGLSPRVIVVWFQNARQKVRKTFENQSSVAGEPIETSSNTPFVRTPSLSYQCKKCGSVFSKYYELIMHQKRHCSLGSNDNNTDNNNCSSSLHSEITDDDSFSSSSSFEDSGNSDALNLPTTLKDDLSFTSTARGCCPTNTFMCEKCNDSFPSFDQWRDHQRMHNGDVGFFQPFSSQSAFGMLRSLAQHGEIKATSSALRFPDYSKSDQAFDVASTSKRKLDFLMTDDERSDEHPKDKRLRTTILPEQLDYLYQKYQLDCNPSRKQLDSIAKEVGLKKRVVQVWFQNTRARERKGQYRTHQQLIHKRCPFCRALFRAKSALESHLATKHPDELANGEINVDALPDASVEPLSNALINTISMSLPSTIQTNDSSRLLNSGCMPSCLSMMPPQNLGLGFPSSLASDANFLSLKHVYDDVYNKYISEFSSTSFSAQSSFIQQSKMSIFKPNKITASLLCTPSLSFGNSEDIKFPPTSPGSIPDNEAPLDLSVPVKLCSTNASSSNSSVTIDEHSAFECKPKPLASECAVNLSLSDRQAVNVYSHSNSSRSFEFTSDQQTQRLHRNSYDEFHSCEAQYDLYESEHHETKSSPVSPMTTATVNNNSNNINLSQMQQQQQIMAPKRYRTQMTSTQVKVMKLLFVDYKTPSMTECEIIGRDIGLPKRVVQVWFQNARAKEKKSSIGPSIADNLAYDVPKPSDECVLCNFKYSHKFTMQDHIFTRRHIDNLKTLVLNQSEQERGGISDISSMTALFQQHDYSHDKKLWIKGNNQTTPDRQPTYRGESILTPMSLMNSLSECEAFSANACTKNTAVSTGCEPHPTPTPPVELAQMMGLGGYLPGVDPSLLHYTYPGLPGYLHNMTTLPFLPPGLLSGAEQMRSYDPMTFGTHLHLLQIPQKAIQSVSRDVQDPDCVLAHYTQDCKSFTDLTDLVTSVDAVCLAQSSVDVGYICKRCLMVYPVRDACITHQHLFCFSGGGQSRNSVLKLKQLQLECRACLGEKFSTLAEVVSHCQLSTHQTNSLNPSSYVSPSTDFTDRDTNSVVSLSSDSVSASCARSHCLNSFTFPLTSGQDGVKVSKAVSSFSTSTIFSHDSLVSVDESPTIRPTHLSSNAKDDIIGQTAEYQNGE